MTKPKPKPVVTSRPSVSDYIRRVSKSDLPEDCVLFIVAMLCHKMGDAEDDADMAIDESDLQAISKRLEWHICKTSAVLTECVMTDYIVTISRCPPCYQFNFL